MSFVSNIISGVGRAVGDVVSSPVGKAALLGAGLYFGAPALSELVGGGTAAAAADPLAFSAADIGLTGSTLTPEALAAGAGAGGALAGGGAGLLSAITGGLKSLATPGSLLSIGSGIYGLNQANQMKQIAQQAAQLQDPFAPQRSQYQQQLSALMANPQSVSSIPGYQAGLDAIIRSQAAAGYLGSGNMMNAMAQYGGQFYQQQLQNLMQLSGANVQPGGGSQLIQGQQAAAGLTSSALGSIGYGATLPQLTALLNRYAPASAAAPQT